MKIVIPKYIKDCIEKIENTGYEAYVVGGAVRDAFMGKEPSDWDITTSAPAEKIAGIFPKHFDTGLKHGTVTVLCEGNNVEITTYRIDGEYTDCRRPNKVVFTDKIEEDLKRRDFTVNAIAYNPTRGVKDPFGGVEDIKNKIIKAVGNPDLRFNEDALRIMRGIRFSACLNFEIESDTMASIKRSAHLLKKISAERIKRELDLFLLSSNKTELLTESGILQVILPEVWECFKVEQNNPWHIYNVGDHTFKALEYTPSHLAVKYAVLMHDLGKIRAKTTDKNGIDHFHGHPEISVEIARNILNRLKFDNATKSAVLDLIACHDIRPEATTKSLKKFLSKHSSMNFENYIAVRMADSYGQNPDRFEDSKKELEELQKLYEKIIAEKQAFSLKELEINGNDIKDIGFSGKEIGDIMHMLLDKVIENPANNDKNILLNLAKDAFNSR